MYRTDYKQRFGGLVVQTEYNNTLLHRRLRQFVARGTPEDDRSVRPREGSLYRDRCRLRTFEWCGALTDGGLSLLRAHQAVITRMDRTLPEGAGHWVLGSPDPVSL